MVGFRSFADDLDQRQPLTSASFASIDDNVDNDKDEDILLINDANVDFKDITVVLAPPPPLPYTGVVVSWGGNVRCHLPAGCRHLSWLPSRHKRWHADLNGLVAALVVKTDLGRPTTQTRPFPPTLNQ